MSRSPSSYLKIFALAFLVGTLVVAGWNALVDPYGIYGSPVIHGFNHYKYLTTGNRERLVKAHQIKRIKPDALILGTSRADWGLAPEHPGFVSRSDVSRPYNAALGGGTIYEALCYLRHAHAVSPVKEVILALDLEMFNTAQQREEGFERRLVVDADGHWNGGHLFADRLATLFSMDALEGSRKTRKQSRKNRDVTYAEMTTRGSAFQENLIPAEKRWQAFKERRVEGWRNFRNLGAQQKLIEIRMKHFEALLHLCHEEKIHLTLLISPYHSALLDQLVKSENWSVFEWWKRGLVEANVQIASEHRASAFPFFDFSGYHAVSMDPAPSDAQPHLIMKHYVECSHYRKLIGDYMLDVVFHLISETEYGIARTLTPDSLENVLTEQRSAMEARRANLD